MTMTHSRIGVGHGTVQPNLPPEVTAKAQEAVKGLPIESQQIARDLFEKSAATFNDIVGQLPGAGKPISEDDMAKFMRSLSPAQREAIVKTAKDFVTVADSAGTEPDAKLQVLKKDWSEFAATIKDRPAADVGAAVQAVLHEAYAQTTGPLLGYAQELKAYDDKKKTLKQELSLVRNQVIKGTSVTGQADTVAKSTAVSAQQAPGRGSPRDRTRDVADEDVDTEEKVSPNVEDPPAVADVPAAPPGRGKARTHDTERTEKAKATIDGIDMMLPPSIYNVPAFYDSVMKVDSTKNLSVSMPDNAKSCTGASNKGLVDNIYYYLALEVSMGRHGPGYSIKELMSDLSDMGIDATRSGSSVTLGGKVTAKDCNGDGALNSKDFEFGAATKLIADTLGVKPEDVTEKDIASFAAKNTELTKLLADEGFSDASTKGSMMNILFIAAILEKGGKEESA
jgi:hypothetical protein